MSNLTQQYRDLLFKVVHEGKKVYNERTGVDTIQYIKEPHVLTMDLANGIPILGSRKMYPHIAAAETAWQLMGTKDASFINKVAPKLWSKFTDEEGNVDSAYGYRMAFHFGRDQLKDAITMLKAKRSSRQNLVSIWDPRIDGIKTQANTPCITSLVLNVEPHSNKLRMHVHIRSSDIVVGLPYDMMNYALLHCAICCSTIGVNKGSISFVLNNHHIYNLDNHLSVVYRTIAKLDTDFISKVPYFSIHDIIVNPHEYISWVKQNMSHEHEYKPTLEVVV